MMKRLEQRNKAGDIPRMVTVKADDRSRVKLPDIKPGQVFAYETQAGAITLTPLKKPEPRTIMLKLVKREGCLVADTTGLKISPEDIAQAVREDRNQAEERGNRF